jgi:hypothetical protein
MTEKVIVVGVWFVSTALVAQTELGILAKSVTELGITLALVVFFVWQTYIREKGMNRRINDLELYQKDKVIENSEKVTEAMVRSANATEQQADATQAMSERLEHLATTLEARPCAAQDLMQLPQRK